MAPSVVVIGGGFGGAYCARELERPVRGRPDVHLLDRNNYFVFYPLLIEAGTGNLQPSHVVVPIRSFIREARFTMAEVTGVDLEARQVHYRLDDGESGITRYDHLVLSPGSITRMPEVPGLREHGLEVKGLADAIHLRDRAIRLIEQAAATADLAQRRALLHWVVVGGNFTGAEVAGEFHAFLREVARSAGVPPDACRVTLVERTERILATLDDSLSDFATENLRRRGVDVRTGTTVECIEADRVRLSDGGELSAATVVWCAGIRPSPLLDRLDLPRDDRGYVRCRADLRVEGRDDVWAIGDCAVNPDEHGRPYPSTAQHAVRQGAWAARNIRAVLEGRSIEPFRYDTLGTLAALGCRAGVARLLGLKLSGFPAWWLHRTTYLSKMPGMARKARVALDWTIDLLLPRDHVSLGLSRGRRKE